MATQLTVFIASGSLVDIDSTLFIQLGIFLFMVFILRSLLFKPVIRLIEARDEATLGAVKKAAELQREAAAINADFETTIGKVRNEATADRNKTIDAAKQSEREILSTAKEHAARLMSETRTRAENEMRNVQKNLEEETRTMALLLAEKILDRRV